MLHTARSQPRTLVIGIDADASSMIEASRRAERGFLPNALFVVAAVESLPRELDGVADEVRIHCPWGSLLRGVVDVDGAVVAEIARPCALGATITSVLSVTEPDRQVGAVLPDDPGRLRHDFAGYGLDLVDAREATPAEIAATRSTWAKRLGAGSRRPVMLLRFDKTSPVRSSRDSC